MKHEIPNCYVCGKPVTEDERDTETGYYYSKHFGCKRVVAYQVVVVNIGVVYAGPDEVEAIAMYDHYVGRNDTVSLIADDTVVSEHTRKEGGK